MKTKPTISTTLLLALCLVWTAGCGDKEPAAKKSGTPTRTSANETATTPLEQSLARWQQGDQEGALQRFLAIDWKNGSAFSPGSPLSLTEKEFAARPAQERERLSEKFMAQLNDLKALTRLARDRGRAVAATDKAQSRRCFSKLVECGSALEMPEGLKILQMTAQAIRKMGAAETGAVGR